MMFSQMTLEASLDVIAKRLGTGGGEVRSTSNIDKDGNLERRPEHLLDHHMD